MKLPPEAITIDTLVAQLGSSYRRFGVADQSRHVELLRSINEPGDIALYTESKPQGRWKVTICASDFVGALSIITGLLTAYGLDIQSADIFTVQGPASTTKEQSIQHRHQIPGRSRSEPWRRGRISAANEPRAPQRMLLDIFEVTTTTGFTSDTWQNLRQDLSTLLALLVEGRRDEAREAVVERVSETFRTLVGENTKLMPMSIEVTNEPSSPYSRLMVQARDTLGFLFAFTNSLAGFTINIERAEIRTQDGEAHDTFWVTDVSGGPICGDERIHELQVATTLVKQFTHLLPRSADPGQALRQFNALIFQMLSRPGWTKELASLESASVLETLADLMGVSKFLWEDFLRMQHENLFPVLLDVPSLSETKTKAQFREELAETLRGSESYSKRVAILNSFKDREIFRSDLRHITGRSEYTVFAQELTSLAEVAVESSAELANEALQEQFGSPTLSDGRQCAWCICALGKFGGSELGYGSDLELIFLYEAQGATDGPTIIQNSEYYARFVQGFKSILKARQEGIFEVDLRLRPYGSAGALASTTEGFRRYYLEDGGAEQFERLALVRLRPVAGNARLSKQILKLRDRFVYSGKPLDIENIVHLRHRQASELVTPGSVNAKYSSGGLVDLEYFVQAEQIIFGYTNSTVRVTNTLQAIDRLHEQGIVPAEIANSLRKGYTFLRRLIEALRVVRGHAKDLTIPSVESREFAFLVQRLHFASAAELESEIIGHMVTARSLWTNGINGPPLEEQRNSK